MNKQRRLEIPEKLLRWVRPDLRERQGEVSDMWDDELFELGWLTQVEAKGPVGFEKWNKENLAKNNKMMTAYDHRKLGWNACLKYARGQS